MTDVFYGFIEYEIPAIAQPRIRSLISEIKDLYGGLPHYNRMIRCPAFRDQISRTYVIRSPQDLSIYMDDSLNVVCDKPFGANGPNAPHVELFAEDQAVFVSQSSVKMELLPAYMHADAPTLPFLGGQYDIGKWVRPVHPTFLMGAGQHLHIKRDHPLMYVRFDRRVKLREFSVTPALVSELKKTMDLKKFRSFTRLASLYDYYLSTGRKRVVMREIKKGLV